MIDFSILIENRAIFRYFNLYENANETFSGNAVHNVQLFTEFHILDIRFDPPQLRRDLISSIMNSVYQMRHKFPNDVSLRI